MLLFRSEEWIDKWCRRNKMERGEVLTVAQVLELSRSWYQDRMSVGYHGRNRQQIEDVFNRSGLTSAFWMEV